MNIQSATDTNRFQNAQAFENMKQNGQIKTDAKKQPESLQEKQSVYKNILAIGVVAGTTFALLGGLWGIRSFSPSSNTKRCELLDVPNLSLPVHCLDNSLSATLSNLYHRYQADSIFNKANFIFLKTIIDHTSSSPCYVNEKSKPDFFEAFKGFQKAADLCHLEAQYTIANNLQKGLILPKNKTASQQWYELAAKQGSVMAQYEYGMLLFKLGSDEEAFFWISKAADQGHQGARWQLGECYEKGRGVQQDWKKAFQNYDLAAATRPDLKLKLGVKLLDIDPEAALHLFGKVAIDDSYKYLAKKNIALMHLKGIGFPKNEANAFHYIKDIYEECKADDHTEFLLSDMIRDMLAVMYRRGIGVDADETAALNLFSPEARLPYETRSDYLEIMTPMEKLDFAEKNPNTFEFSY